MSTVGTISKMLAKASLPIHYSLPLGDECLALNPFLGKTLSLKFMGKIICIACQQPIKKSYQDGYCFPCVQRLARCDLCIVKPERCHYHLGTCREPDWGQSHCMVPHYVYLANASGLKVGITRVSQIPTRWIDQGAIEALPIMKVPTRRISGLVEVEMAQCVSDRTHWQKMLRGETPVVNLIEERDKLLEKMGNKLQTLPITSDQKIEYLWDHSLSQFDYPVLEYPKKVVSLSFDKTDLIQGTLLGIKGQYLLLDTGVLNIRRHSGYVVAA